MKTFQEYHDSSADFVRGGYVVYRGVFDRRDVNECYTFVHERFRNWRYGNKNADPHLISIELMDKLQHREAFRNIVESRQAIAVMRRFLGPDICIFNYDALWINVPKDKNPVLLKGDHVDAWTGTSVNTIFAKVFLTDVDAHNGIAVCPGSHLQGMLPVRNRKLDRVKFKRVNLSSIKAGDWLLWHPLLVHATVGHSAKATRISITSRYTSTESAFSSQERALGYRTLSVGPLNQILRLVGNDYLTPLRTYGGTVGIDKRLAALYK